MSLFSRNDVTKHISQWIHTEESAKKFYPEIKNYKSLSIDDLIHEMANWALEKKIDHMSGDLGIA